MERLAKERSGMDEVMLNSDTCRRYVFNPSQDEIVFHIWTGEDTICKKWTNGDISTSAKKYYVSSSVAPTRRGRICKLCNANKSSPISTSIRLPVKPSPSKPVVAIHKVKDLPVVPVVNGITGEQSEITSSTRGYLYKVNIRKGKANKRYHLFEENDSICRMYSTGGMSSLIGYVVLTDKLPPNEYQVCSICKQRREERYKRGELNEVYEHIGIKP